MLIKPNLLKHNHFSLLSYIAQIATNVATSASNRNITNAVMCSPLTCLIPRSLRGSCLSENLLACVQFVINPAIVTLIHEFVVAFGAYKAKRDAVAVVSE